MPRRRLAVLVSSLALSAATVFALAPSAVAGAAKPRGSQSAVCPAVPTHYARCLVKVVHPAHGAPLATTPVGYSPAVIAGAYAFATTGGSTKTIAIIDAYGDPTITSNFQTFSNQYGLGCTHCFTKVNQTGKTSTYPRASATWGLEQSLDVEWAHALAPKAHVLLVQANSNSFTNLMTAVRYGAAHAQYVSMSWGGNEFSGETSYDSSFKASGVSYFAASGDSAGSVIYPSSSPNVLSIGGTTLGVSGTTWTSEKAWSSAGGGCSSYESPSTAQKGYATYDQATANCHTKRATPDISLDASPTTGVAVYDTEGQSGWLQVGGTSASTVMVAAHATETGQQVNAAYVYGSTIKVYDVTSGSNSHPCEIGYDLCTGVGSWNTAVGKTSGSSGSTGTLSIAGTSQTLTAGSPSAQMTVDLSKAAPAAFTVTLTSSGNGSFATSPTGSFTSTLAVHVAASSQTSAAFYYENTTAGQQTVTASATNWTSASQVETVKPAALNRVTVSPASATVSEGAHQLFTATGYDQFSNRITITPTWSTTAPGTLTASGATATFTAGATAGTGLVKAAQTGITGSAAVKVVAMPQLAVTVRAGSVRYHHGSYTVGITAHVSSGGTGVSGATVIVSIYRGSTCTGTVVAIGSGSTNSSGTASFSFKAPTAITWCAKATATKAGYLSGSGTTTFTT
jgi:hypothetical protein